jgi:hypothetical protein
MDHDLSSPVIPPPTPRRFLKTRSRVSVAYRQAPSSHSAEEPPFVLRQFLAIDITALEMGMS